MKPTNQPMIEHKKGNKDRDIWRWKSRSWL